MSLLYRMLFPKTAIFLFSICLAGCFSQKEVQTKNNLTPEIAIAPDNCLLVGVITGLSDAQKSKTVFQFQITEKKECGHAVKSIGVNQNIEVFTESTFNYAVGDTLQMVVSESMVPGPKPYQYQATNITQL